MKIRFKMLAAVLTFGITAVTLCSCMSIQSDVESEAVYAGNNKVQSTQKKAVPVFTVIIDPGHGFDDPGSHPEFIYSDEAVITLRAALILKEKLKDAGIKAVLTHDGISFPTVNEITAAAEKYNVEYDSEKMKDNNIFSAYERVIYANTLTKAVGSCFYVSLHTNSVENSPSTCGVAIDYYENSPFNKALDSFCMDFQRRVKDELNKSTVIFADNEDEAYIVNKYCLSPSVLIEMGYGSNREDGIDLMNDEWLERFCETLTECIAENKNALFE